LAKNNWSKGKSETETGKAIGYRKTGYQKEKKELLIASRRGSEFGIEQIEGNRRRNQGKSGPKLPTRLGFSKVTDHTSKCSQGVLPSDTTERADPEWD